MSVSYMQPMAAPELPLRSYRPFKKSKKLILVYLKKNWL